jgi:hypothetical protein
LQIAYIFHFISPMTKKNTASVVMESWQATIWSVAILFEEISTLRPQ